MRREGVETEAAGAYTGDAPANRQKDEPMSLRMSHAVATLGGVAMYIVSGFHLSAAAEKEAGRQEKEGRKMSVRREAGYDGEKRQFLGRGSYAGNDKPFAEADEGRMATCGHICDPLGAILIGRKVRDFDARAAYAAGIAEIENALAAMKP
jgi:hypothetical protein